jgi:hypothetical protein
MQGVRNLALEAIVAMLAADLELPVPQPFVVELVDDFLDSLPDGPERNLLKGSDASAFGSEMLPTGFAVWPPSQRVPPDLCQLAAEVYAFDQIIVNSDRRPENPNCLHRGFSEFAIFDHELTLAPEQVLFWKAPWIEGAFEQAQSHIFGRPFLSQCPANLDGFRDRWLALPDDRFAAYLAALPPAWRGSDAYLMSKIEYLLDVKAHIVPVCAAAIGALL